MLSKRVNVGTGGQPRLYDLARTDAVEASDVVVTSTLTVFTYAIYSLIDTRSNYHM